MVEFDLRLGLALPTAVALALVGLLKAWLLLRFRRKHRP